MLFIVVGLLIMVGSASAATTGNTTIVSIAENGTQGGGSGAGITYNSISDNGRYVVFTSTGANFVANDTNAVSDVFVKDTKTGKVTLVSVATNGSQGNGASSGASISGDGNYVVFLSSATNLVEDDTNAKMDVFLHNLLTNTTTLISKAANGTIANAASSMPFVSADGRFVSFNSAATNLVPGDIDYTGIRTALFLQDTLTGTNKLIYIGKSSYPPTVQSSITPDGRYLVFTAIEDLVPEDTNAGMDVYIYDTQLNTTTLASVTSNGTQANTPSYGVSITPDGRYVVFVSNASNLVENDTNGKADVFVRDMLIGVVIRVNVAPDGTDAITSALYAGQNPVISDDGRYVAFYSTATNLVSGDTNNYGDVFIRDLLTNTTIIVSVATDGTQSNQDINQYFDMSSDGRYVIFASTATNLVAGDTNIQDVFIRDLMDIAVYPGDDLASIIANVREGSLITIYGASGSWNSILNDNVVIDKQLTIVGVGNVIITAANSSKPVLELTGNASGSVISGLTIKGSSYGVLLNNVNNITITDSNISGSIGLKLLNSTNNTLTNNTITSLDNIPPVVAVNVGAGVYNTSKTVSLTSDDANGIIYYTTNGSTPTASSAVYSGPITIGATTTLKFIAVDENGNWSPVYTKTYTIDKVKPTATASLKGGLYKSAQKVTLKISESGAIYYTLNGSTPTKSSKKYTGPISVTSTATLKFLAVDKAGNKSPVYTAKYTIDKTAPRVSSATPKSGTSNVKRSSTLTIKFSETIKNSTNWSKIYVKDLKTGKKIAITKSIKGNVLTIKTSKKSAATQYQVYIPTGSVKDTAGNNLAKAYTYKIKTGNT